MDCIQTENKAVDLFGAGKHGFQPGDPGAGVLATFVSPAWCNGVQEEILNVIRAAGLAPNGANLSQMLAAINALVALKTGGPGEVKSFARTAAPTGWLKCDGTAYSRATYAALFAVIGTTFGVGDGATTFNVPDLRGEFVRGLDDGRGVDAGRGLGTAQAQQLLQHAHGVTDPGHGHGVTDPGHGHGVTDPTHAHGVTDPTHTHGVPEGTVAPGGTGYASGDDTTSSVANYSVSQASATGVTVNNAATGVTVNNAAAGVSVNNAAAGITIQNSAGGAELRVRNVALLFCISF